MSSIAYLTEFIHLNLRDEQQSDISTNKRETNIPSNLHNVKSTGPTRHNAAKKKLVQVCVHLGLLFMVYGGNVGLVVLVLVLQITPSVIYFHELCQSSKLKKIQVVPVSKARQPNP